MLALKIFLLPLISMAAAQLDENVLPVRLPPVSGSRLGENTGACPLPQNLDQVKNDVSTSLDETVVPELNSRPVCPCGGDGSWSRIAHLDMSDPSQQCPPNWRLLTTPVRACGAASPSCASAVFPSNGQSYSRVCGRVIGIQKGAADAFHPSSLGLNNGPDGIYLDGISLTHGLPGSRQHIWSFVTATAETSRNFDVNNQWSVCPCTNTNYTWPHQVPSFVGSNYFCDTGNPGPGSPTTAVYADDPLWDGAGCGPASTCCQLNTPPWFCTTLPQPTTDDLELRICQNNDISEEDTLLSLADIYIM